VCKKLIKNSQPFGKKLSENRRGDFFDSHCRLCFHFLVVHHNGATKVAHKVCRPRSLRRRAVYLATPVNCCLCQWLN